MFEWLFEFLFKYPPWVFHQGTLVVGVSRAMWVVILVVAGLAGVALFTYRGLRTRSGRDRVVIASLRAALLLLLLFCLVRPTLVNKVAVPQQNFLGVLIDDSRSMQIADTNQQPRSAFVTAQLSTPASPLLKALQEKFVVRTFKFANSTERIQSTHDLTYGGTATDLGDALLRARDELSGLPLAGLVVVTDGDDTSEAPIDDAIGSLKADSLPVFPVGVGAEHLAKDVQVSRVETPQRVLKGSALVVDVVISQTGYAGATVPLIVENEGHVVDEQQITLPPDGQASTIHVHFTAKETGPRVFRFRIPPQPGEQVTENNARDSLIEVVDDHEKLLYLEGEPRFEAKFVEQAMEDDKNLQVSLLQRTAIGTGGAGKAQASDKYLRLHVDSAEELANGFPDTEEELFGYRGLILGSVEASAFTPRQMQMLADFVSKRGGGLLALGGRRSFAEGGWGGTPVGDALPVMLPVNTTPGLSKYFSMLTVGPTREGLAQPMTQIADTEEASQARWKKMPQVSTVNPIYDVKPGATTLLTGVDQRGKDQVVLAWQRYGRGKALAFPIQDSWLWRMDPSMPVTDTTHHVFWQRMLRWLVDGVPGPVEVTTSPDAVEPGEPVTLLARVTDAKYDDVDDGQVVAHVTAPSGRASDVPLAWTVTETGQYKATFTPDEEGLYAVKVSAAHGGSDLGSTTIHLRTAPSDREYFDAAMRASLLKRLADATGGRFYTASDVSSLADAISYSGRGVTTVQDHDLWDMPIVLLLLLACAGAEWAYRRARGVV